ncbi:hypothetical protein [Lichenibacterium ramalinae]|uniref:Uncharacterized protein n=1 Tax=Lichenibacterium ramalinae TaxID=2316527 RepID=A0A4Q2RA07_9HYPH|nr:hypothetical protein [Lichenibacterium ramalinae]RYB03571.1 hypothetical protein D3272_15565 [Lichenibacterium ramalinae]
MSPRPPEGKGRFELVVDTISMDPGPDDLVPLDEAATLPRLRGLFDKRALYKAVHRKRNPLRAYAPVRDILTTPRWIDQWIEGSALWLENPPASTSTGLEKPLSGTSTTPAPMASGSSARLASAKEASETLKANSPRTSRLGTPPKPKLKPMPSADA